MRRRKAWVTGLDYRKATRDSLYESRQDDVISSLDDLTVATNNSAHRAFDDGEDRSPICVDDNRSLNELVKVRKEDPRAVEDNPVGLGGHRLAYDEMISNARLDA